jgi:hypothetical protein
MVGWPQVLGRRLQRQGIEPNFDLSEPGVADRLGGVQAQVSAGAPLAIAARRVCGSADVRTALAADPLTRES